MRGSGFRTEGLVHSLRVATLEVPAAESSYA